MPDALPLPFPAPLTDLLWTGVACAALLAPAIAIAVSIDRYLRRGGLFGRRPAPGAPDHPVSGLTNELWTCTPEHSGRSFRIVGACTILGDPIEIRRTVMRWTLVDTQRDDAAFREAVRSETAPLTLPLDPHRTRNLLTRLAAELRQHAADAEEPG